MTVYSPSAPQLANMAAKEMFRAEVWQPGWDGPSTLSPHPHYTPSWSLLRDMQGGSFKFRNMTIRWYANQVDMLCYLRFRKA